ncbi:MAG: SDR family oxidoreductase [Chloroflexota bacterium]
MITGRLHGKVAVVTGAASGIGRAIALGFLKEGATVWFMDRAAAELSRVEPRGAAHGIRMDVSVEDQVAASIDTVANKSGRLDILVHCAAIQAIGRDARLASVATETWDETLGVNLRGTFLVAKHGVNAMLAAGNGGSVILCGSPTAMRGSSSDSAAYSTSKGGVHALCRVLAVGYGGDGIRVNTLVPGPTSTALTEAAFRDPVISEHLMNKVALGRLGRPEDYVGIAVFLASDESSFATGAEFVVDGGSTIT